MAGRALPAEELARELYWEKRIRRHSDLEDLLKERASQLDEDDPAPAM